MPQAFSPHKLLYPARLIFFSLLLLATVFISSANAQQNLRSVVVFKQNVDLEDIAAYVNYWTGMGARFLMHVPMIHGIVLETPDWITEDNLNTSIVSLIGRGHSQTLIGSGEGGAGEGGAGEGGAGEGGALLENVQLVDPYLMDNMSARPWGFLNTLQHPYDPLSLVDSYQTRGLSRRIKNAISYLASNSDLRIAVFDTGVDVNHSKLRSYIVGGIDLVNVPEFTTTGSFVAHGEAMQLMSSASIPVDDNGHGTHVTGSIGGKSMGIAEGIDLYAVKVLDGNASGDSSTLVMALQWALDNDIDIVNMSVAFQEDNPALRLAVEEAHAAGLIMIAAVGNHSNWTSSGGSGEGGAGEGGAGAGAGGGAGSICSLCTVGDAYSVMYPAKYPEVIAVGANDAFYLPAWFSNTGPETDVLAPGMQIVSTIPNSASTESFGIASGSSMATPHVTAVVALMQSVAKYLGGWLSPSQVQVILRETSVDGVVDLEGALWRTASEVF